MNNNNNNNVIYKALSKKTQSSVQRKNEVKETIYNVHHSKEKEIKSMTRNTCS